MKLLFTYLLLLIASFSIAQIPQTNLVGYWDFQGNANDQISNNNGTLFGSPIFTTDRFNQPNSAVYLDGIDDRIVCSTNNLGVTNEISISAWIKIPVNASPFYSYMNIVNKYSYPEDKGYALRLAFDNSGELFGRDGNNYGTTSGSNGITLQDGNWHNLIGVIKGDIWSIYIDGQFVNSYDNNHANVDLTTTTNLALGGGSIPVQGNNYRRLKGKMDDVAIYNRALDLCEIIKISEFNCSYITYDTIQVMDTINVQINDTVTMYDTIWNTQNINIYDSITVYDTVLNIQTINVYDTIIVTDTIFAYDSITVTDTLVISRPLNINSQIVQNNIKVYPNPTVDKLVIHNGQYYGSAQQKVEITNSNGQLVFSSIINQQTFQVMLSDFGGPGLYFISLYGQGNVLLERRKIVLQ